MVSACFHELGNIEFRDSWARFSLDMGTTDELSLDILINLLIGFSKEFTTFTEIILGGENLDWPRSTHKSRLEQLWDRIKETDRVKCEAA